MPTKGIEVLSGIITETKDVLDKEVKEDKFGDMWWEALKSKTHSEESIPKALEVDKRTRGEAHIAYGRLAKNFRNELARETSVGLWDNGTTPAVF